MAPGPSSRRWPTRPERAARGQGVGQHRTAVTTAAHLPGSGSGIEPRHHRGCLTPIPRAGPQGQAAAPLLRLFRSLPHRFTRRRGHDSGQPFDHLVIMPHPPNRLMGGGAVRLWQIGDPADVGDQRS